MTPSTRPRLVAPDDDGITRQDVARAAIDQSHREYRGDNGQPWKAYDGPTTPWAWKVKRAGESQYRIVVESRPSWWQRLLRRLR